MNMLSATAQDLLPAKRRAVANTTPPWRVSVQTVVPSLPPSPPRDLAVGGANAEQRDRSFLLARAWLQRDLKMTGRAIWLFSHVRCMA